MPDRDDLADRLRNLGAAALPALLALRLSTSLDGMDSVNFALALSDYDPGLDQPHFPGYPVYIALCRLLAYAGLDEALALALPGILAAPALVLAADALGRRLGVSRIARIALTPLMVLHPLILGEGPRPIPDLLATALVWSALAFAAVGTRETAGRRHALIAGGLLGVVLGIRADLAPFLSVLIALPGAQRRSFLLGLAAALAVWLPAFVAAVPPGAIELVFGFASGHFGVWGSSLLAGVGTSEAIAASVLLAGGGVGGLALCVVGARRAPRELQGFLLPAVGPYVLWVILGQNLAHARHWLPVLPAVALLVACAFPALGSPIRRTAAATALLLLALPVYAAFAPRPDGRAFVARVVRECGGCEAVYVGDTKRLFDRYAPAGFPAYRRSGIEGIRLDLEAWGSPRSRILATDEVAGAARSGPLISDLAPGPSLYRVDPAALR